MYRRCRTRHLFRQGGGYWQFLSSIDSNATTISGGSGLRPGDLALLNDGANGSAVPTLAIPAGWTQITPQYNDTVGAQTTLSYKVLASADLSAGAMGSITGMDGNSTDRKMVIFFRPVGFVVRVLGFTPLYGEFNRTATTINLTSAMGAIPAGRPAIEIGWMRSFGTGVTWTVPPGSTSIDGGSTAHRMAYRLINPGYKAHGDFSLVTPATWGGLGCLGLYKLGS